MKTDRELLKLAAKAAKITLTEGSSGYRSFFCCGGVEWNPLTDDGDALRLAVKLDLIDETQWKAPVTGAVYNECNGDWYAATRRAIVRAAAELGSQS